MKKLRVAFLSGVRHADSYLEWFTARPEVEVVGVGDSASALDWIVRDGKDVAGRHGVPWLGDPDAWLDPAAIDLAVVCSEPTRHAELALLAIERGVRVLVDKPLATELDMARRVVEAARAAGVSTSVVNRTFAPALRRLRGWVDAGHLGLPRHLDMEFFASGAHFATSVERPELVVDRSFSGGGELQNFLGYCVDAITYVTGLPVQSVTAMTGSLFMASHIQAGVEDVGVLLLQLEHGVSATVTVGRIPQAPGHGPTTSSLRVLGSHGHAVADDDRPGLTLYRPDATVATLGSDGGRIALDRCLAHVVDRALQDSPTDYQAENACSTLAVIEAAYRSAASGSRVEVESSRS